MGSWFSLQWQRLPTAWRGSLPGRGWTGRTQVPCVTLCLGLVSGGEFSRPALHLAMLGQGPQGQGQVGPGTHQHLGPLSVCLPVSRWLLPPFGQIRA